MENKRNTPQVGKVTLFKPQVGKVISGQTTSEFSVITFFFSFFFFLRRYDSHRSGLIWMMG